MATNDSASSVIRFNEITQVFEYSTGKTWTPVATLPLTGGVLSGSVSFSGTTNAFSPPVLTTTQRDALTPTEGMVIYNSTTHKLNVRTAAAWEAVTSA